jgi:hypothetical protein
LKNGVKGTCPENSQDKFWTYPQFVPKNNTELKVRGGEIDFYHGKNTDLDAIYSTEEEDSTSIALGMDENLSENERRLLRAIIKYFPDPSDYIIGFHC